MIFKFRQKGLFIMAGIICLISVFLSPLALVLFYMASRAKIEVDGNNFVYTMLNKKIIQFSDIKHIMVSKPTGAYYKIGYTTLQIATVVPLVIHYSDKKKVKLSLNAFERSQEILDALLEKTNLQVEEYRPSILWG